MSASSRPAPDAGLALPDLAGRRALITGADSGVGLEIARRLARAGAGIVMPVRSREKGARAAESLAAASPGSRVELCDLDLARLDSVRALAGELRADGRPIDLLVLNAGVVSLGDPRRRVSADGFELHFQTNFLGHFALTTGLLPLLRASGTRIAVQCSLASAVYGVAWPDLQFERRYGALRAYGSSKTALGLFAYEVARRERSVTMHLCHPGIVPATAIAPVARQRVWPWLRDLAVRRLGNTPQRAAEPALAALTTDAPSPAFFAPSGALAGRLQLAGPARERHPFRRIADAGDGSRIWEIAERLGGSS